MATNGKKLQELILKEIQEVKTDFKVMAITVAGLDKRIEVIDTRVEERTGKKAIIVSSIGGIITFAATIVAAMLLK